jgi:hypothetical protein
MSETTRLEYPAGLVRAAQQRSLNLLESTAHELLDSFKQYAHEKPVSAALWGLGIGFVLGWKLKPW